ncbi:hypothetical protein ILYODFUR_033868 [Ilyodon furcidens]|uniref:Uncharacterized protein n=1 Tax=Ilyodon furcidens TaxID=33524 RepID=A0ABV0TH76_9TELE
MVCICVSLMLDNNIYTMNFSRLFNFLHATEEPVGQKAIHFFYLAMHFLFLSLGMESSESLDLWLLERLVAVEQNVSIWRLHKPLLHLPDESIVEAVPRLQQRVVTQCCVVTHVQVTCVVLGRKFKS